MQPVLLYHLYVHTYKNTHTACVLKHIHLCYVKEKKPKQTKPSHKHTITYNNTNTIAGKIVGS